MERRSSIIGGLILILVGGFFLLIEAFPALSNWIDLSRQWPLLIVGAGVLLLVGALFGSPPLAVPGTIVTGLGGILYYQNATGDWGSWSYIWTLIPGLVGLGMILMSLLDRSERASRSQGVRLLAISVALFAVFWLLLSGSGALLRFWPAVLIALGLWLVWRSRSSKQGSRGDIS